MIRKKIIVSLIFVIVIFCSVYSENIEENGFSEDAGNNVDISKTEIATNYKKNTPLDVDMKVYLPSVFGHVSGWNPMLVLRQNSGDVGKCLSFMDETRFCIPNEKFATFSFSFASAAYSELISKDGNLLSAFSISIGTGVYFHLFDNFTKSLNGLCFYLYPLYQIPIFCDERPYYWWKSAFDIGYNITFFDIFSFYPYMRTVFAWNNVEFKTVVDYGIALGFYLEDKKLRKWMED